VNKDKTAFNHSRAITILIKDFLYLNLSLIVFIANIVIPKNIASRIYATAISAPKELVNTIRIQDKLCNIKVIVAMNK
jgi:hypothetical protein